MAKKPTGSTTSSVGARIEQNDIRRTFEIKIVQSESNPQEYAGFYYDNGELKASISPNTYEFVVAMLAPHLHLAKFS